MLIFDGKFALSIRLFLQVGCTEGDDSWSDGPAGDDCVGVCGNSSGNWIVWFFMGVFGALLLVLGTADAEPRREPGNLFAIPELGSPVFER